MTHRPIILLFHKPRLPLLLFGLLFFLGGGWYTLSTLSTPNLKEKIIVIDPGHGGQDPGAQYGGIKEKDINLDIALRLREILTARGCSVLLTREEDKDFFLPNFVLGRMAKQAELSQRVRMASMNQADIFISVHANSYPAGSSYGMETYYHVKSLAGKELADLIQTELKKVQPDNKRKAKSGDYYLLNQTQMPAVLVEVGFLSNAKERKLLQNTTYQEQIAEAISAGIEVYFHEHPYGIRDAFLDNSNDLSSIKRQIRTLIELAKKNGKAIGIGHIGPQGPTTARAIREMLPELQKEGIQIVPLSELVN